MPGIPKNALYLMDRTFTTRERQQFKTHLRRLQRIIDNRNDFLQGAREDWARYEKVKDEFFDAQEKLKEIDQALADLRVAMARDGADRAFANVGIR